MRILTCVKRVPMTGGKIVLTPDAQAIETKHLGFTISPHEECGVEEAVRLDRGLGRRVGRPHARPSGGGGAAARRDGARGRPRDPPRRGRGGVGRAGDGGRDRRGDPLRRVRNGPLDLIFFGNESADAGGYQIGIRVAYALGRPVTTGLKGVSVEGESVRCEQEAAGGRDVYVLPLPAVVSVLEGLNLPRYPSVPAKLRAQRKPLETSSPAPPSSKLEKLRLVVPESTGKEAEILGRGPEAAPAVVEVLQRIGVA